MYHTADRPLLIEMIRTETREYNQRALKAGKHGRIPEAGPGKNLLTTYTANQWIELEKQRPQPKRLFGEFWYQDELCILFADTNAGKSILAVQIGNSLTRTEPIGQFAVDAEPANVLYIDFELSGKQFVQRYTDDKNYSYNFGNGFFRSEFNPAADMPPDFKNYDNYVNSAIDFRIRETGADILIIDNITCLRSGTERAAEALPLMKHLKALKAKYKLSILVLAHTPKRNPARPITRNDLQGSKMLINFADSAFAIGRSYHDKTLHFLKQVKQRSTSEVYGDDNVCLCRISKPGNFLRFEFEGNSHEQELLRRVDAFNRLEMAEKINDLIAKGISQRQISQRLNISKSTVNKYVHQNQ